MGKLKTSKNSLVVQGPSMNEDEFKGMIKEAEKGPFYTIQQASERINNWKTKYSK